jgi:dolichol-phosphate mannosyltransferase
MDRKAVDSILVLREKNRYLPGLRAWVGYKNSIVYYDRQDRLGGEGKLSFVSRIKYAMDAITSFSYKPLRLTFALFALSIGTATLMMLCTLLPISAIARAGFGVASAVFGVGGMVLLSVGVLGEYVGRIYDEVRNRPLSLVSQVHRPEIIIETEAGSIGMSVASHAFPGGLAIQPAEYDGRDSTKAA